MKRILILDTETTGLDSSKDSVIEVGCILFDVEHATPLVSYSTLLPAADNPAEPINRIPAAALREIGSAQGDPWAAVAALAAKASAFVAHHAEFDRRFVPAQVRDLLPWICSKDDLVWPRSTGTSRPSLVALALAHDLGVAHAHRALADCELISRLLMRAREMGADLSSMLERGLRPKVNVIALVSFDDRDKARTAGFQWDPGARVWSRRMAADDVAALPFRTRVTTEEARNAL